jgi:hypothetical protein
MGQPNSETKKADLLKRAEARLNFALNLPAPDVDREAKIKAAEKAIKTALASKTGNVRKANASHKSRFTFLLVGKSGL